MALALMGSAVGGGEVVEEVGGSVAVVVVCRNIRDGGSSSLGRERFGC